MKLFLPNFLSLKWDVMIPGQEKGRSWEQTNSTIYYKYYQDEVDNLSERSSEAEEDIRTKLKWIAFKQQFFASVLIADSNFPNAYIEANSIDDNSKYIKHYKTDISIPYTSKPQETFGLKYYFGPNHYNSLRQFLNYFGSFFQI